MFVFWGDGVLFVFVCVWAGGTPVADGDRLLREDAQEPGMWMGLILQLKDISRDYEYIGNIF